MESISAARKPCNEKNHFPRIHRTSPRSSPRNRQIIPVLRYRVRISSMERSSTFTGSSPLIRAASSLAEISGRV